MTTSTITKIQIVNISDTSKLVGGKTYHRLSFDIQLLNKDSLVSEIKLNFTQNNVHLFLEKHYNIVVPLSDGIALYSECGRYGLVYGEMMSLPLIRNAMFVYFSKQLYDELFTDLNILYNKVIGKYY